MQDHSMASARDPLDDQHLASAPSDDSFGHYMSVKFADLVSQPSGDIETHNNSIDFAEDLLADAPSDLRVPADVWKNLSVLYDGRYQQTKDLDDLQTAITWAEQGAAVTPQSMDQLHCLNYLIGYLVTRYEQTGELEDLREAEKQGDQMNMTINNLPQSPNMLDMPNVQASMVRLKAVYETSPQASLDLLSATISDLLSQASDDIDYLNTAIIIAEEVLTEVPNDLRIPTDYCNNLSVLFEQRYQQTKKLDDLQSALTWAEQAAVATPRNNEQLVCVNNFITCLLSRYELIGELEDLRDAAKRVRVIRMGLDNIPVSPNIILSMRKTIERFETIYEASPLALLESISTTISDLAT